MPSFDATETPAQLIERGRRNAIIIQNVGPGAAFIGTRAGVTAASGPDAGLIIPVDGTLTLTDLGRAAVADAALYAVTLAGETTELRWEVF